MAWHPFQGEDLRTGHTGLIGLKRRWLVHLTRVSAAGVFMVILMATGLTAQAQSSGPGIYVCVDAKGRRITSDRPIPECLDREQRELNASGVTRRVVPPSLTADERARDEAAAQQEAALRSKEADAKRRDRALLARYPSVRHHDAERNKQLEQVDVALGMIEQRNADLRKQQLAVQDEMEFYKADPSKAPAWLKQRASDVVAQQASQKRLAADQLDEKKRINARFDEELARLKQLLAGADANTARPAPSQTR